MCPANRRKDFGMTAFAQDFVALLLLYAQARFCFWLARAR